MPAFQAYGERPCVLLTNDDGPPAASSPNIFSFYKLLRDRLGWDVKVVIPNCQKSWVGKAYAISDVISLSYFYPQEPDGLKGDITNRSRPLKNGETMEWIMLSGTPATCSNIALHNLYPGQIDLVISGPNYGRNSSTAFALSSGTLGASLAAALSVPVAGPSTGSSLHADHIPSIAVSYGVVTRPVPEGAIDLANDVAVDVCARLWEDWGYEDSEGRRVQVYSVNVPLVPEALDKEKRKVVWTNMWRNAYGQLFKQTQLTKTSYDPGDRSAQTEANRPDKPVAPQVASTTTAGPGAMPPPASTSSADAESSEQIRFHFAPTMGPLLNPTADQVPVGSDAWAFAQGYTSVTPIRAEYAGLHHAGRPFGSDEPTEKWAGKFWQ